MKERRQHERINSPQPLPVLDQMTGEQLGLLIDLSIDGLLIETNTLLQAGSVYQLEVMLPLAVDRSKNIEFTVKVAWAEAEGQTGVYCAGLFAIDLSDYELVNIEQLLKLWVLEEMCVNF